MNPQEALSHAASLLAISVHELVQLIGKSPYSYKSYEIKKKSGGFRLISQPARETKYVQRILIDEVFSTLPVHEAATAYKVGSSIKINAAKHRHNTYLSKFDFYDFFKSIKEEDLVTHFSRHFAGSPTPVSLRLLARVSCISYGRAEPLALSVGAPSSPILSNSVMYEFDLLISEWCQKNDITYTRYADDLTFSSNCKGISFQIEKAIAEVLQSIAYPRLILNREKTIHLSKKHKRRITGLIVNNNGNISLGRDRKRLISSMIHRYSAGSLSDEDMPRLQGLLGFAEDAEPLFSSRMRAKYGIKLISEIFQHRKS